MGFICQDPRNGTLTDTTASTHKIRKFVNI